MTTELDKAPCKILRGVGPQISKLLEKLSIYTLQDLLFHLPLRYLDRTHLTPLKDIRVGDYVAVEGVIESHRVSRSAKASLVCELKDNTGYITLRFFHFTAEQVRQLSVGTCLRCFGEVRHGYQGLEIIHPDYLHLIPGKPLEVDDHLTPIYPSTEGISQWQWRRITEQVLEFLRQGAILTDHLALANVRENISSLEEALLYVHRPPPDANREQLLAGIHPMQQRLALEELLAHQIGLSRLRRALQTKSAPALMSDETLVQRFLQALPFALTAAQQRVLQEIRQDMQQQQPMLRLLQGDVGSGKTVVAGVSLLQAIANGYQGALMAPTEILAEQHYHNLSNWFSPLGIKVTWLSGKVKGKARQQALTELKDGISQVAVGTHALFQDAVEFKNLALLIIDEQHRFGVDQRLALRDKGVQQDYSPHQLIMTATPIPRTLSMSVYSHLDHSIIDELPPGRKPVQTVVLANDNRDKIISRVEEQCLQGKQTYWICPLIEDSEKLQCEAATKTQQQLIMQLPNLKIGLVHGALSANDKAAVEKSVYFNII